MKIPYLDLKKVTASYGGELERAISETVTSGWYLHGGEVERFEREFADYIGPDETIACASGLDALWLIFRAYIELGKLKPGDEIIVPANTFIASILAVTENGLTPVLVEPDPDTLQIDPEKIEGAVTSRTKGVMIVHLYGRCAYAEKIGEICRKYDLLLVEDNAQAHGCRYGGRRTGSLGDVAAHSFYPGKNLGALGDAGAVTVSDPELAKTIRSLADYGSTRKYVFKYQGRNSRMDELQATALRVKLPRLDADNARRKEIAARYFREIVNPLVELPFKKDFERNELLISEGRDNEAVDNVFHIFPVLSSKRDELQKHLADCGVQTLIHYPIPPHLQECYRDKGILRLPADGKLDITLRIHNEELSLPLSPILTDEEISHIIASVNSFRG